MKMYVKNKNNELETFSLNKLNNSIRKAFELCNNVVPYTYTYTIATIMRNTFKEKFSNEDKTECIISSDDIIMYTDITLNICGYSDEAHAYANYMREKNNVGTT